MKTILGTVFHYGKQHVWRGGQEILSSEFGKSISYIHINEKVKKRISQMY